MIDRWQEATLLSLISERRGVHLTGARQSGKTTLAEHIAVDNAVRLSLDNADYLKSAREDPAGFVNRKDGRMVVIDEIQKAPELLDAMKIKLDHDNSRGQYLITGSSNLRFMKKVKDSLAGRLGRVRLRTLSQGEIQGAKGDFLRMAFSRSLPDDFPRLDKRDVIHSAFCGGYPEPMAFSLKSRRSWYREYVRDLLTKDVQEVTEIRKIDALEKVFFWMMAHSSKFFEQKDLCAAANIGKETVSTYLSALKALYIIDEVPAWSGRDYSKIGKRAKYFASDAGLVSNYLGWDEDNACYNSDMSGKLVETWVHHQLAVLADLDDEFEITQYRDSDKREVDFIVKNNSGYMLGIEVKAGGVAIDDFKHLRWFGANMAKGRFTGIVLYSGDRLLGFGDGFFAVPLSALAL